MAILQQCSSLVGFSRFWWPLIEPERKFQSGWHLECIGDHLEDVMDPDGVTKNIIINIPPRCSKSLFTCVFFPTYQWGENPASRWMFASFAGDLVQRDSVRRKDIIKHPLYQHLYGIKIRSDQDTVLRYTNQYQGFQYAVTVGGQGMGEGADFLIVDDPINPRRALSPVERAKCVHWYRTTFSRRSNDERTVKRVIIMQRLHEADLTGYLIAESLGYDHLVLPMRYEPRRYFFIENNGVRVQASSEDKVVAKDEPKVDDKETSEGWEVTKGKLKAAIAAHVAELAAPRDAIRLTRLQHLHPTAGWFDSRTHREHVGLIDGPGGSGRENQGDLLWPARFSEEVVAQAELELAQDAPGQYQQRPSAETGDIFQRENFRRWEPVWEAHVDEKTGIQTSVFGGVRLHGPNEGQERTFTASELTFFQTIDTALTEGARSSYTAVATLFATPEFDLGVWHVFRARLQVQYQYDAVVAIRQGPIFWNQKTRTMTKGPPWPFRISIQAIEAKASGIGIIQTAASKGAPLHPLQADGDKVARSVPVATMYTNGKVYHPVPSKPWVVELEDELCLFPNGSYKDQADVIGYGGIMVTKDKIIRGMCQDRKMAEGRCEKCNGRKRIISEPDEAGDCHEIDCPVCSDTEWDQARKKEALETSGKMELDVGGGKVTVQFPDDDGPLAAMFGANWR